MTTEDDRPAGVCLEAAEGAAAECGSATGTGAPTG